MKRKLSRRHHYLPINYLKGFTDSRNCFFIYDKQADRIFGPITPNAFFYENDLNTTIHLNGSKGDFLEDLYTNMENRFWGSLDRIRRNDINTPIEIYDKMHLFLFLLFLHWRLPSNISFAEQLSKKAFIKNGEFDFQRLEYKNGGKVPEEIIELVRSSSAFKKSFRQVIPFVPFFKDKNWSNKLEKWQFIYTGDDNSWYIVGDNPIVTKGDSDHDPINCLREFAFPVSGKLLLVNTGKPISGRLSSEFILRFNISIIERSQKFVACQNSEFLEALKELYKLESKLGKKNSIILEMFKMLEQ
jgi:hypothetical protein